MQNMQKKNWNISADSLANEPILIIFEINPRIRITVLNYTVIHIYEKCGISFVD